MAECGERAVLIVTRAIEGTSTTIAQNRVSLVCTLPQGHEGDHRDTNQGEAWDGPSGRVATVLRHEELKVDE
jgi:hypothetical protein